VACSTSWCTAPRSWARPISAARRTGRLVRPTPSSWCIGLPTLPAPRVGLAASLSYVRQAGQGSLVHETHDNVTSCQAAGRIRACWMLGVDVVVDDTECAAQGKWSGGLAAPRMARSKASLGTAVCWCSIAGADRFGDQCGACCRRCHGHSVQALSSSWPWMGFSTPRSNVGGTQAQIKLSATTVEVWYEVRCVACHERSYGRHQQVLDLETLPGRARA
jgi:hypothetical protein